MQHELTGNGEGQTALEKPSNEDKSSEKSDTPDNQVKAEAAAPKCPVPDTSSTAVQASMQIPLVCITECNKDMFNGLYQV